MGGSGELLSASHLAVCRQAWHVDGGPLRPRHPATQKRGGNRHEPVRREMLLVNSAVRAGPGVKCARFTPSADVRGRLGFLAALFRMGRTVL